MSGTTTGANRLNGRKCESFKVRGIFNEFAQKLIFHCNLLFICGWRRVPSGGRVSPQSTLSRPHSLKQHPKPRENGILAKANIALSGLKGLFDLLKKSCSSSICSMQQIFTVFLNKAGFG